MAQPATSSSWDWRHETPWRVSDDGKERTRAEYGLHRIGSQEPYFSVTGEVQELRGKRWREGASGQVHEAISAAFPELRPYLRWHLASAEGPMHYIPNGMLFFDEATGRQKQPSHAGYEPAEAFARAVVLGAMDDDPPLDEILRWERGDVVAFLTNRLTWLRQLFKKDMEYLRDNPIPGIAGEESSVDVEEGSMAAFAVRHGIYMSCTSAAVPLRSSMPAGSHYWQCRLSIGGRSMTVPFNMGPAHGTRMPEIAEVLSSLADEAAGFENSKGNFESWASELGFDIEEPDERSRVQAIYRAIEKHTEQLRDLLTEEAYRELLWETDRL